MTTTRGLNLNLAKIVPEVTAKENGAVFLEGERLGGETGFPPDEKMLSANSETSNNFLHLLENISSKE